MGNPNNRGRPSVPKKDTRKDVSEDAQNPAVPGSVSTSTPAPNNGHSRQSMGSAQTDNQPNNAALQPASKPATLTHQQRYLARRDPKYEDIVIHAKGVEQNLSEVTEGVLPDGTKYRNFSKNTKSHDFIDHFKKMSSKDRKNLLASQSVQILVKVGAKGFEVGESRSNHSNANGA